MKRVVDKEFWTRVFTSIGIIILSILFIWGSGNLQFTRFCTGVLNVFVVYEIFKATSSRDNEFWQVIMSVIGFILPFIKLPYYAIVLTIAFMVAVIVAICMMTNRQRFHFRSTSPAIWFCIVINLFFVAIPNLRILENGLCYLIFPMLICITTDVFAYLIGRKWGKTRLAPTVSPNKTVEGAAAGIIISYAFALLFAVVLNYFASVSIKWKFFSWYALLCSAVGQFGDLTASVIKRIAGVKDFGTLLPGHGGILDRLDSHSFAFAFTYIFCSIGGMFLG